MKKLMICATLMMSVTFGCSGGDFAVAPTNTNEDSGKETNSDAPECQPSTCQGILNNTHQTPCGMIMDGCGGIITCQSSCPDPKQVCGGSPGFVNAGSGETLPVTPGVCSGDCEYIGNDVGNLFCSKEYQQHFRCSNWLNSNLSNCQVSPLSSDHSQYCCKSTLFQ